MSQRLGKYIKTCFNICLEKKKNKNDGLKRSAGRTNNESEKKKKRKKKKKTIKEIRGKAAHATQD